MTTMIFEVYSAFLKAGVPEDVAMQTTEALSADSTATRGDIIKVSRELAVIK